MVSYIVINSVYHQDPVLVFSTGKKKRDCCFTGTRIKEEQEKEREGMLDCR
jgi:hypothetical protein